jgi:hypothetical protein
VLLSKKFEFVSRGRKPLSNHNDIVLIGSGKDVEIAREQLLQEQLEVLVKETGSI